MMQRYNMQELADFGNNNNNFVSRLECTMLLGVTGRNAAGKTTIVEWFVNQGWDGCSCSDAISLSIVFCSNSFCFKILVLTY